MRKIHLAMAIRCFCPPERLLAPLPTTVSNPSSKDSASSFNFSPSNICQIRASWDLSSDRAMFSRRLPRNSPLSCWTTPIWFLRLSSV